MTHKDQMPNKPVRAKGRFQRGTSGNPSGRPAGSRNQATLIVEQLLEGEAEQITRKVVELAKQGNIHALRLCLERLVPPRKERYVELDLKPIQDSRELPVTFPDVIAAVAQGRITPNEGSALANIMTGYCNGAEAADLARRVQELESHLDEFRRLVRERAQLVEEIGREP